MLIVLIDLLEDDDELLEIIGVQIDVVRDALGGLHLVDLFLKQALGHAHDDVRKHLHEAAVAVVSEAGVAGLFGQALDGCVVQAEVEDGVHHAGHGCTCAGADRYEERIFKVAELLSGDAFHLHYVLHDLCHDLIIDLLAVFIVLRACLGGNGEALGYGQTDVGHFRQVCALAAEKLTHFCVAFGEQINILLAHWVIILSMLTRAKARVFYFLSLASRSSSSCASFLGSLSPNCA